MIEKFWTAEMINSALEHIENHKGKTGMYTTDKARALVGLAQDLHRKYPLDVSTQQLESLFAEIWKRHQRDDSKQSIDVLFLEGRSCLDMFCDRSVLLARKDEPGLITSHAEYLVMDHSLARKYPKLEADRQIPTTNSRHEVQGGLVPPSSSKGSKQIATPGKAR